MRSISEQQIMALAPNANAAANGRRISAGGGFVSRMASGDDTFYMGECRGSGKSNYMVSADFLEEGQPVFRCSCPSRQFPCKHALALLFEMAAGKDFPKGEIPPDIITKRQKRENREGKKADRTEEGKAGTRSSGSSGTGKAARAAKIKKLKKQSEGLELMRQLTGALMENGLAAMGSASLKNYRDLSRQLGDYYLPGPQTCINGLILEMEAYQKDSDPAHYKNAVEILKKLRALEKKAEVYLQERIQSDNPEAGDDLLYEELGGIWKLGQLNELGLKKEDARLLQLAFRVYYDEARKEYIDQGFWADADTGEVAVTYNYRPLKALKYVKQEDSCFDLLKVPVLTYYPGEPENGRNPHGFNRRIRWDKAEFLTPDRSLYAGLKELSYPNLSQAVKAVKNQLKNTLADDYCVLLLAFDIIGTREGQYYLRDQEGKEILLACRTGWEDPLAVLAAVPDPNRSLRSQSLLGLMAYDRETHKMVLHPLSILTEDGIIRLLY